MSALLTWAGIPILAALAIQNDNGNVLSSYRCQAGLCQTYERMYQQQILLQYVSGSIAGRKVHAISEADSNKRPDHEAETQDLKLGHHAQTGSRRESFTTEAADLRAKHRSFTHQFRNSNYAELDRGLLQQLQHSHELAQREEQRTCRLQNKQAELISRLKDKITNMESLWQQVQKESKDAAWQKASMAGFRLVNSVATLGLGNVVADMALLAEALSALDSIMAIQGIWGDALEVADALKQIDRVTDTASGMEGQMLEKGMGKAFAQLVELIVEIRIAKAQLELLQEVMEDQQ
mmetsp:Transcript_24496/g.53523  ORF Transcript_24496/g.53523 Transcript_24496/m.53523 type:complete len:293 (-) Transcript_24496:467-1345(-)